MKDIRRRIIFSVITGSFFSLLYYFSTKLLFSTTNNQPTQYTALDFVFITTLILFISLILYFLYELKIKWKENKNYEPKRLHFFIPLMLFSIITFLAFFPGHYPYDSSFMYESFQAGELTNHFSPLITVIIGIFLSVGNSLGSKAIGHAALIILQTIFINFALTETIFYCTKKTKNKKFGIVTTLLLALNPLVQTIIIRSGQDTIFGGLFLLLCLEFLKISENKNYFSIKKKQKFFYFFILIFFLCATRNNGIYALVPAFISALFIFKKNRELRKNLITAILIPVTVFLGYNYLFLSNIVTEKDSFFRETSSVPVMQIARSMYYNPDDQFINELEEFFKTDCKDWGGYNWRNYNKFAGLSDPYKNCLDTDKVEENPIAFFDLWRRIGEQNVLNYIEAPLVLSMGLYHPYVPYPETKRSFTWHKYIDSYYGIDYGRYGITNTSIIPPVANLYNFLIDNQAWSKIPIFHILWSGPFTTLSCLLTILYCLYRKKYNHLLPLMLIFGLIITVALSPVMLFRYIFPAVICMPILLYILKSVLK